MHLSAIDLNLLPLLDALLTERHVTRAAERVGLSQPAASRGLARLRALVGDPLLVRSAGALVLTPRGEALREPVRRALGLVASALAEPAAFEPALARRTIRIASDDYSSLVLLPGVLERLARGAPGLDLWVTPVGTRGFQALVEGEVDLVFAPLRAERPGSGLRAERLFEDRFVCAVREGHPLAGKRPSLDAFVAAPHAFVAPRGRRGGAVDDALAAMGRERRVALAVPHFLVMPFLVARSDLVVTLGARIAATYERLLPLVVFEPPLRLPRFSVALHWHERDEHDPALAWLRGQIAEVAAEVAGRDDRARAPRGKGVRASPRTRSRSTGTKRRPARPR